MYNTMTSCQVRRTLGVIQWTADDSLMYDLLRGVLICETGADAPTQTTSSLYDPIHRMQQVCSEECKVYNIETWSRPQERGN